MLPSGRSAGVFIIPCGAIVRLLRAWEKGEAEARRVLFWPSSLGGLHMNTAVTEPQSVITSDQDDGASSEESVRSKICGLLANFQPRASNCERRSDQRYAFPYMVHLTPMNADGSPAESDTVVVVGKHLSKRGLGFYHTKPLPYRRMIVSIETGNNSWLSFLIDLSWCRFTKQGWYESGGRFLRAVPTPGALL